MKTWIMLAAIVVALAVPTDGEAHWRYRRYGAFYGAGYPGYTSYYYAAPSYYVVPPVVAYYPPVYAAPVVSYRPVAYRTYYAPTYYAPSWYAPRYSYYYSYGAYPYYGW